MSTGIAVPDELVRAPLMLAGLDNGAWSIMAAVTDALRAAGNQRSVIVAWRKEAMSSDYGHLLRAAMTYTYTPGDGDS